MIADKLVERIRRDGPISVADYMDAVTDAYYARGDVFGAGGDFTTAPEISQTFGELIGLWCAVMWRNMGSPAPFRLVECGPGRGTLMQDLLRAAGRIPGFMAAADIHLVERSEALRLRQRETLKAHKIAWHGGVSDVPPGPMLLVGNEFLDALPIHQYEMTAEGWRERRIGIDGAGDLKFVLAHGAPSQAPQADVGAVFETSPAVSGFTAAVASRLTQDGGAALLIDYGYQATAVGDTLQAVKKHKPCGIFETPGEADLTAHVNFAAVGAAARQAGAKVYGPVAQGAWLNSLGIKLRGVQLAKGKPAETVKAVEAGIRRLTEPDAMGLLFKVIAFAHPALATPDGFPQDGPP